MRRHITETVYLPTALRIQNKYRQAIPPLIPAAQYVRMSDEAQQYSVDNQKQAIAQYASHHGFKIVKTYADLGKSGVVAKNRTGLRELLKDVVSGDAEYKAVLVYDVSRWGRFPNSDEAAHYEYLCSSSGIPLHYCAEPFSNDGTASSSILKALKRSMAAEYSRELGEKVFRGQSHLVQLGFRMGGPAGYGYHRLMISADGKRKRLLKRGEQKNVKTDRIKLVLGPKKEVAGVRLMFSMAANGHNCTDIARVLNAKKILIHGREWNIVAVRNILTNPKYVGCNVWNRHTQRMRTSLRPVESQHWIVKPSCFPAIVNQETFDRAQATLQKIRDSRWSREKLLKRIRRLLKAKGRLSETLMLESRSLPSTTTIRKFFGTYRQLYDLLGYDLEPKHVFRAEQGRRSARLRQALGEEIKALFPENVFVQLHRRGERSILRIDDTFMVSILFCGQEKVPVGQCWGAKPAPAERDYITLLCLLNRRYDRVLHYYVAPKLGQWEYRRLYWNSPFLRQIVKLDRLEDFYSTVTKLWNEQLAAGAGQKNLLIPARSPRGAYPLLSKRCADLLPAAGRCMSA